MYFNYRVVISHKRGAELSYIIYSSKNLTNNINVSSKLFYENSLPIASAIA